MNEMILDTRILPEPIFQLISAEKIKIRKVGDEIHLTPINESADDCPLLGLYSDGKLTVDAFLKWKREDKELES